MNPVLTRELLAALQKYDTGIIGILAREVEDLRAQVIQLRLEKQAQIDTLWNMRLEKPMEE